MNLNRQGNKHGDPLKDLKTIVVAQVKEDHCLIKADTVQMEEVNLVLTECDYREEMRNQR